MDAESTQFRELLLTRLGISGEPLEGLVRFRELVVEENTRQNLTRLLSPVEFFEGHILDAWELLKSGAVTYPAMDLGSGAGVPGILCALLGAGPWVICDSETRKAEFLGRAAEVLGLQNVRVVAGRAEDFLKKGTVSSVVARAVGPVERIYAWLKPCSTWNNLVLLKGPGWAEEWTAFQAGRNAKRLKPAQRHDYQVESMAGGESKTRVIIRLDRA